MGDNLKCVICGKEIEESCYMNAILCSSKCFEKNYWNEIIKEKEQHVIINGVCYMIGGLLPPNYTGFAGFGGRMFHIKYFDGRIIQTNNLWLNGEVPKKYRDILKDEAEFHYPQIENKGGANN